MKERPKTLGQIIAELRSNGGWSLREMSKVCGIPVSTLSKVEHDQLTLSYDKICQISERLGVPIADFFADPPSGEASPRSELFTARRSMGTLEQSIRIVTPNYETSYLCTELLHKKMVPLVTRVRSKSLEEFGPLQVHSGEEFVYVLDGDIEVHTEFYDPVRLRSGEFIYLDSSMGHGYLAAEGCDEALILAVCAGDELSHLIALHDLENAQVEASEGTHLPQLLKPFVSRTFADD